MRTWIRGALLLCAFQAKAFDQYNSYQWPGDSGDWYEWWYYKVTVPGTNQAFYFVYGTVNPWDLEGRRPASSSYVGMGHFGDREIWSERFSNREFSADRTRAYVRVGSNEASESWLRGELLSSSGERVVWDLTLEKNWAFNAMGWSLGVPGISNIYWYPAQASARMSGTIHYKEHTYVLDGAPAYQDRNWGRSLPSWWVWIVSNAFENAPGSVLSVGGGRPSLMERWSVHDGFGIGLKHAGREYAFRSPDGDTIHADIRYGHWEMSAENKRNERIEIQAYAPPEKFMLLPFVSPTGETFKDYEALQGNVRVKLYRRAHPWENWRLEADLLSDQAGIEYGSFDEYGLTRLFSEERQLQ